MSKPTAKRKEDTTRGVLREVAQEVPQKGVSVTKKKLDLSIEELTSSQVSEFTEVEFYQGSSVN